MTSSNFSFRRISTILKAAFAIAAIAFSMSALAQTYPVTTIATVSVTDWGLVFDAKGNLYGVNSQGGDFTYCNGGCGQVFELSPTSGGGWMQRIIYTFAGGTDGSYPSGLILDAKGNLYGTTSFGGSFGCGNIGCGTVFELSNSRGGWNETLIHVFSDTESLNGLYSGSPLVFDKFGNLYGTTGGGGTGTLCNGGGCGVAFELSPAAGGLWNETVLYNFAGGSDGFNPGSLTLDAKGNIFGAMQAGGTSTACGAGGCGVVFELKRTQQAYKHYLLHSFDGTDGQLPNTKVILDASGNIYGTTVEGGPSTWGVAFELMPTSGNTWREISLHNFVGQFDGANPTSPLIFDKAGNLYGTTANGNTPECQGFSAACGQVFELSPVATGWKISARYPTPQHYYPLGGVTLNPAGNIFGTAYDNHYLKEGVAFEITP